MLFSCWNDFLILIDAWDFKGGFIGDLSGDSDKIWCCILTLALRNTSKVIASRVVPMMLRISLLFILTTFTLSINIMKSPGSRWLLSAGESFKTLLMWHGFVHTMSASNPNSSLQIKTLNSVQQMICKDSMSFFFLLFSLFSEALCNCENRLSHLI